MTAQGVRVTLDLILDEDSTPSPITKETLAKELSKPKIAKMLSSYLESVVITEVNSGCKTKTLGAVAHVHKRGDQGCLEAYEANTGELGTYPEYA